MTGWDRTIGVNANKILVTTAIGLICLFGLYIAKYISKRNMISKFDADKFKDLPAKWVIKKSSFIDLTQPISEKIMVYPGDPTFQCEELNSLEKGNKFALKKFSFGNHTGTHIDFPAHVINGGKTSSDYDINNLIGEGIIIEISQAAKCITENMVSFFIQ